MEITNAELQNQESTASVESLNVSALATDAVAGAENESLEVDGGTDSAQAAVLAMSDSEEDGANVDYQGLIHDAEVIRDETGEGENTALRVGTLFLDILRYIPNVNGGHKLLKQWSQLESLTADEIENQYVPNAYLAKDLYDRIKGGGSGEYLSKLVDDIANGHITFQKGLTSNGTAIFNSGIQISGNAVAKDGMQFGESFDANILTGFGGKIDGEGNGTLESLTIRRFLEVPELRFNRVEVKVGDKWRAAGAGIIESIQTNADGTGTADLKLEDGEIGLVAVGDLCMGIFHDLTGEKNAIADSDDSKGNRTFAGFYTCYFRIEEVSNVGSDQNKRFRYRLRKSDGTEGSWSHAFHPSAAMHFVVFGNNAKNSAGSWLHPERQSSVYETRTYTRMLRNQTDWEITETNIALQYGDMSNMSIHGMSQMDGYSIYLNNVYVKGNLRHVKDNGDDLPQINFLLSYPEDGHFNYYDAISFNGSSYICVNKNGTNTEPSDNDPTNWQVMAEKGASINGNGRFIAGTHYVQGSVVNFADAVWVCNKDTDLAPYPIYMTADGKYLQYSDGGYALVSMEQDEEHKAAWGKMFDTSGIKDGENGKDGASLEVQYSSDGSSWHATFVTGDLYMRQRLGSGAWSSAMRIVGENGSDGEDGQYQDFQFAIGQSLTQQPETDQWFDAPPTVPSGYYLWMRTRIVYPDGSTSAWAYTRIGGEQGNGISNVTEWYLATNQETGITFNPQSHAGWSSDIPSNFDKDHKYLWNVEQISYTKDGEEYTTPSIIAVWSKDGKGIKSIKEWYLATNVSTGIKRTTSGWTNAVQYPTEEKRFLWNYEQIVYNEGEDTFTEPAIIGVHGEKGKDGETLVKNLGLWSHNLKVGYLEIVRMGNGSFQCVNPEGTMKPPYGCYTTATGEYLRYSDGGYVLNGEENFNTSTADYNMIAMDGEQGETGKNGVDGDQIEYVYFRSSKAEVPTLVDESSTSAFQKDDFLPKDNKGVSWTDSPKGVTETERYEFVSIRTKTGGSGGSGGTWGKFSNVTLWSMYGEKGQDGDGVEYVFYLTNTPDPKPLCTFNINDSKYQNDDYLPTNGVGGKSWTDDPSGVSSTNKYEWVAQRKKTNGKWQAFTDVALWAKYSVDGTTPQKNKDFFDGKDATFGQLSVSSITMQVDGNGNAIKDQSFKIGATIIKGNTEIGIDYIEGLTDETYVKFSKTLNTSGKYSGITVNIKKGATIKEYSFQIGAMIDGVKQMFSVSFYLASTAIGYTGCSVRAREWSEYSKEFTRTITKHRVFSSEMSGNNRYEFQIGFNKIVGRVRLDQFIVRMNGSIVMNTYPKTEFSISAKDAQKVIDTGLYWMNISSGATIQITAKICFLECEFYQAQNAYMFLQVERRSDPYQYYSIFTDGEEANWTYIVVDSESGTYDSNNVIRNYYFNESSDADKGYGTRYIDIVLMDNPDNPMGYDAFRCKQSHFANQDNKPNSTAKYTYGSKYGQYIWKDFWEEADAQPFIQTDMLFAKHAKMRFASGNQILLQNENEQVIGGLSGFGTDSDQIRLWVGAETPSAAPFFVKENGELSATSGIIGGQLYLKNDGVHLHRGDDYNTDITIGVDGLIASGYSSYTNYVSHYGSSYCKFEFNRSSSLLNAYHVEFRNGSDNDDYLILDRNYVENKSGSVTWDEIIKAVKYLKDNGKI